ncbi:hypothetical protein BG011_001246 [Mortierella polycephala]|uniref:Uncharacterized protein n=1 Tax=Mortierella polycephala TaxID=41804 RepID=A0A9P6TVD9_9FUNG|nr:hypothetical protein BG011_001246 [Mortierella polycephala]
MQMSMAVIYKMETSTKAMKEQGLQYIHVGRDLVRIGSLGGERLVWGKGYMGRIKNPSAPGGGSGAPRGIQNQNNGNTPPYNTPAHFPIFPMKSKTPAAKSVPENPSSQIPPAPPKVQSGMIKEDQNLRATIGKLLTAQQQQLEENKRIMTQMQQLLDHNRRLWKWS